MRVVFPGSSADKPGSRGNFTEVAAEAPNLAWEQLSAHVFRCRLRFCDVTVGLVASGGTALLVDTGTTLAEARTVAADVRTLTGCDVGHVLLTHHHFDHILGRPVFGDASTYCAAAVTATMTERRAQLRADALHHGADPAAVDRALAALVPPRDARAAGVLRFGEVEVTISHPGRGHTDHDLIAVVTGPDRTVVFCGDLVEESADPSVDAESDLAAWPATLGRLLAAGGADAVYVPGHGAVVDAGFVRRQADDLARSAGRDSARW